MSEAVGNNQVDQFLGYTGMTPARFRAFAQPVAYVRGLSNSRVILGGDHLGPNCWQSRRSPRSSAARRSSATAFSSF